MYWKMRPPPQLLVEGLAKTFLEINRSYRQRKKGKIKKRKIGKRKVN
jgi:hypothetical protein